MRLRNTNNAVELTGVTNQSGFNIQANGKAFDILSKGLYTDSIMAVVRELSCNAYDAMVEAGKGDVPFSIHLPSKLEPFFSVKDKGIGLSPEDVTGLYSTYFASTKTNTNDQIGAFGLGSKSPFSYSKAFDVIACWEGKVRTYSVFMDDEGIPTMSELACVDTDEENGIEVKIAVRQDDYESFRTKTADVLRHFPLKPNVLGYAGFKFNEPTDTATVTSEFIIDRDKSHSDLIAVQGNVPYKVKKSELMELLDTPASNFLNKHAVTLFFPIGSLDVAANREEVRYDEDTVKNIADAVAVAFDNYLSALNDDINNMDIKGNRYDVYALLQNKFGNSYQLKGIAGDYQFDSAMVNEWVEGSGDIVYTLDWSYHKIIPYKGGVDRAVKMKHETQGYGTSLTYNITPGNKIRIVKQDVTKGGSMRMNSILSTGWSSPTILAIVPITDRALILSGVTATQRQRNIEYNKIVKMFGGPKVDAISDITDDIKSERKARQAGNTFKQFQDDRWVRNKRSKPTFLDKGEPELGGLYIEIDFLRNFIVGEDKVSWSHNKFMERLDIMLRLINYVNKTDLKPQDVYGLTKKVVKSVGDNVKWISLIDAYRESFATIVDVAEYYKRANGSPLSLEYCVNEESFQKMVAKLDTNSNFRELLSPMIKASKVAKSISDNKDNYVSRMDFNELLSFNKTFGVDIELDDTNYIDKADVAEYKMLDHIDLSYSHHMDDAKMYIEMVEQAVDFV